MFIRAYMCICAYVCMCVYIYMYTHVCACMHACVYKSQIIMMSFGAIFEVYDTVADSYSGNVGP